DAVAVGIAEAAEEHVVEDFLAGPGQRGCFPRRRGFGGLRCGGRRHGGSRGGGQGQRGERVADVHAVSSSNGSSPHARSNSTGFFGVSLTSPMIAPGHHFSQSACCMWFSGALSRM